MSFDPYHQWLGIPPEQQPPDCYQLLGLRRFEQNPTVISNAAERQLLMLKSFQSGPHVELTQKLMKQVTAARIRLLDPEKKARYDAALHRRLGVDSSSEPPVSTATAAELVAPPSVNPTPSTDKSHTRARKRSSTARRKPSYGVRIAIISGAVVAASMALLGLWIFGGEDSEQSQNAQQLAKNQPVQDPGDREIPPWVKQQRQEMARKKAKESAEPRKASSVATQNPDNDGTGFPPTVTTDDTQKIEVDDGVPPSDADAKVKEDASADDTAIDDTSHADPFEETKIPAAALSLLPSQFNLAGMVTSTGTNEVFVGRLGVPVSETWRVAIEDYGSLQGESRFVVGDRTNDDAGLHWPLFRSVSSDPGEGANPQRASVSDMLARVDADASELSLWLSDPKNQELIDQLSRCGLVIVNEDEEHHVQLATPRKIPPVTLALDKTRERITLEGIPFEDDVSKSRWYVEIFRIAVGAQQAVDADLQADFGEEVTVIVDSTLQCELGISLVESDEQLGLSVMPRFFQGDRKESFAPSKLTRDITRSKTKLARSQRDFAQAQNALRVLPSEISRAQSMPARSPPEAAARQSRLSQLVGMRDSAQARVSRLTSTIPELANSIKRMEEVLVFTKDLPDQIKVHFRVYARGESEDFLLLIATDTNTDPQATGDSTVE